MYVSGVQSQVESYQRLKKWYLTPPCLTLSIIRYVTRVKWSNPGEGVAPSPTPRCSSYWKGSLRVALDYSRQLYLLYIYISMHMYGSLCVFEDGWSKKETYLRHFWPASECLDRPLSILERKPPKELCLRNLCRISYRWTNNEKFVDI